MLARLWTSLVDALATWFAPKAEASVASTIHYFHTDHLGSSNVITDSTGTVVEISEYTPYGSFSPASPGPRVTSHGFTGQRLDSSTGLYFYNARYYDPSLGRFTQPDSIVPAPSDPQALNRYSYVRNNPINLTDPSGHGWFSKLMGAIAGVFVTVITGGCISCGIAVYNFTDTLISARQAGVSWGRSLALAYTSALIGAVMPAGVLGMAAGGALQGVVSAAILGGDIGKAAWTGAIAGATTAVAGPIIGSGVHAVLNGDSFGHGAAEGAYGAIATAAIVAAGTAKVSNSNTRTAEVAKAGQSGNPEAAATQPSQNKLQKAASLVVDVAGKIWTLPNTAIGLAIGGAGLLFGGDPPKIGNNAIQFSNVPFFGGGAITFGNTILYGRGVYPGDPWGRYNGAPGVFPIGVHEQAHTYQYEVMGPLYGPAWILGGGPTASNPWENAADNFATNTGSWWP